MKIGDRVKIVKNMSLTRPDKCLGMTGTIVGEGWSGSIYYVVDIIGEDYIRGWFKEELQLLNRKEKLERLLK